MHTPSCVVWVQWPQGNSQIWPGVCDNEIEERYKEIKDIINDSAATEEMWFELLAKLNITVAQAEEVPALAQ